MRVSLRSPAGPTLGVLAAAALAGCASASPAGNGVAAKTPTQIVAAAESAAAGAATAHVAGSIVGENEPISLDMELVANKGGKGRLALEGLSIELIDLNRAVYIRGNGTFYRRFVGRAGARRLQGKWLKASAESGPLASLASLANLSKLIDGTLAGHGALARAGTGTVNGQSAVGVTDASRGGTLYVATTGAPYPIEIRGGGRGGARITFDRWNRPVSLQAPTDAINIKQLHRSP